MLLRCLFESILAFATVFLALPLRAQETALPRIAYRQRVLDNGLAVLSVADRKSPTVAIQVWYRVGSKDDPAGRSGFAHLFEHLMFKRTKNMKDEMLDRLTEDVGGENNAYTSADVTVYHEVVPSHYLETLLWAEADRLANLQVDNANFASERDVVKEEYRQGVLAPPYGRLDDAIDARSWTVHPYKRPTIGNIAELNAATLDDVRAFHRAFYRPDNAVLVVVGDFEETALDGWVDRYFGNIPKPAGAIPRVTLREPARVAERRFAETAPLVPLPALALTYLAPSVSDADADALRLLETILASGESSRLYRALVYTQQVASEATAYADLRTDGGLLVVRTVAAGGKSLDALEKATLAELARLRGEPVSTAELARAKNRLLTAALRQRETAEGIAQALGDAAVLKNDPERLNVDLERLQRVSADDIQRVAARYFADENRVALRFAAGADTVAPAPDAAPLPADPAPRFAPEETPPAPAPPRAPNLPAIADTKLSNGLRVIVLPRPGSGLVAARLVVRAGGALDPPDRSGRARLMASLLTKGTTSRSAVQIAEQIEALGADLDAGAGWDSAALSTTAAKDKIGGAVEILADVARRPAFTDAEWKRLQAQTLDELAVEGEEPGTLARLVAARLAFGEGAYGHPLSGTPASVRRLRREELAAFHRAAFRPDNAFLVLSGDITVAEANALATKGFGDWRPVPGAAPFRPRYSIPPIVRRIVVIDKPDAGQAAIVLIRPAIARGDKDYFRALVANSVLGGGYSSRLNREIRINRGLSYGAGSGIDARVGVGPFVAATQTKNESAALVAQLLVSELDRLASWPLLEPELAARKASLTGPFARTMETAQGLGGEASQLALYGLPLEQIGAFLPSVEKVTASAVTKFVGVRLAARYASLVVVGDSRKFLPELKKRFGRVRVIPAAKLNLEGAIGR